MLMQCALMIIQVPSMARRFDMYDLVCWVTSCMH